MYLNVNLTPSSSETGPGTTPKTPEILNSLMSLTTPPISSAYSHYHSQVNSGDLLSPSSSTASPCDELSTTQFGSQSTSQMSPGSSDPGGGGCILARVSGVFRGGPALAMAGTPSPPVPELPSPINTIEATKSALIKEGLKHQIKSKLQAAGKGDQSPVMDTVKVKEENSDSSENLTPQDEERRLRRRERNKIAATKCRNKKKEKTITLMTESESVEDQNIRLKSEIQRLTSERTKLEKLLGDPCHKASCRHSCRKSNPPMIVISSPTVPEHLSSPSSMVNTSSTVSRTPVHSNISEQLINDNRSSFPGTSCGSSYEASTPCSSYMNLSPCSIQNVSPNPQQSTPLPQHSPHMSSSVSVVQDTTTRTSLPELVSPVKTSNSCMSDVPISNQNLVTCYQNESFFVPTKATHQEVSKRHYHHQPYTNPRQNNNNNVVSYEQRQSSPYSGQYNHVVQSSSTSIEAAIADYLPLPSIDKSYYGYESNATVLLNSEVSLACDDNRSQSSSSIGKMRTVSNSRDDLRYSPYGHLNRVSEIVSGLSRVSESSPEDVVLPEGNNINFLNNQFNSADLSHNNPFFSSCSFENI